MGTRRCPYTAGTFRALRWADGPIWIACWTCRRYVELALTTDVAERQVGRTRFTCSRCGGEGHLTAGDPARDGFALDPRDNARRHQAEPEPRPSAEPSPVPGVVFCPADGGRPTF